MLLFWCPWFKYRFIKLDLVTVGKFCFQLSHVLGSVVDCVNVNPARTWRLNHALRNAHNVCALTKVGTVLKAGAGEGHRYEKVGDARHLAKKCKSRILV